MRFAAAYSCHPHPNKLNFRLALPSPQETTLNPRRPGAAQENQVSLLIEGIENMTGKSFPVDYKSRSIQGASELDLVRSGLEDTMMDTYDVISKVWNSNKDIPDLRTAAMMVAVQRVAQSYASLGI